MKEKIIQQGAEAILIQEDGKLIKRRLKKGYRLAELDEKLRKLRTRKEAKLLERAVKIIFVPKVFEADDKKKEIHMEFIDGKKLSQYLDDFDIRKQKEICFKIGEETSKLHENNIIHGDLTTSNMILFQERVYFIDFGLGFENGRIEDKAVDLHLLRQALEAKHFENWRELFEEVKKGYRRYKESEKVLKQLEEVERRGRYKGH